MTSKIVGFPCFPLSLPKFILSPFDFYPLSWRLVNVELPIACGCAFRIACLSLIYHPPPLNARIPLSMNECIIVDRAARVPSLGIPRPDVVVWLTGVAVTAGGASRRTD